MIVMWLCSGSKSSYWWKYTKFVAFQCGQVHQWTLYGSILSQAFWDVEIEYFGCLWEFCSMNYHLLWSAMYLELTTMHAILRLRVITWTYCGVSTFHNLIFKIVTKTDDLILDFLKQFRGNRRWILTKMNWREFIKGEDHLILCISEINMFLIKDLI